MRASSALYRAGLSLLRRVLVAIVALSPWGLALYLHYWFTAAGVWDPQHTPFRELKSAGMLCTGMVLSFYLYSTLTRALGRRARPGAPP